MAEPNTSRSAIAGRELVAVAGLNFSFLVSCYFYGAGFNPVFLIPVYVGPLLLLLMLNHARISELWSTQRNLFWASCCVVFCIAFQHLFFSISPDSSFIPSLVLASLPIWAVTAAFLHDRERLWMGVSAIVCIFALISVFDFIVLQQRAHAPLWDPNSYATLLYLVWVPWVLRYLGTEQSRKTADGLCFGLTTVFCLAMLATESRWAMLVIGSVGSFVVLSCWWFKLSWKNAMYPLGGMVLASAVAFVVADSGASGPTVQVSSFELARSETHRLLMLEATSEAIRDLGGWSGTGLYTFSLVYPLYRTVGEQHTTGLFAHNDFIQFALEGGVWLTVPMVMFAAWVFYHIAVALKGKVWQRDIGMLIALGLVIANSLVNYVFYTLPLLILIGILIGCYWQRVEKKVGEGTDTKHVRPVATRLARVAMLGVWMFTCATLYLDSLTFGVFSNHLHVPGSVQIRTSTDARLFKVCAGGKFSSRDSRACRSSHTRDAASYTPGAVSLHGRCLSAFHRGRPMESACLPFVR